MITRKREKVPDGFWGVEKGPIRMIDVTRDSGDGSTAVYVIEEPPGYRTVRYNTRKYRIFCPWVYFFALVSRHLEVHGDNCLYVFFSRKHLDSLSQRGLLIPPLSNQHNEGGICMPEIDTSGMKSPVEVAMSIVWNFWASEGKEYSSFSFGIAPALLRKNASQSAPGRIFSNWSRLEPNAVMNLDFRKSEYDSIEKVVKEIDFSYM